MAEYQIGLVTISDDPLRRLSFSSKQLEYYSYGLPVLVPAWRTDPVLAPGTVAYTEETFLDQVASLRDPAVLGGHECPGSHPRLRALVGLSPAALDGVPVLASSPVSPGHLTPLPGPRRLRAVKPAPRHARRGLSGFWLQLGMALVGLTIGALALSTPSMVRIPAELAACLLGPAAIFFRTFRRLPDLGSRLGATLIAVLASWTAAGTGVLALGVGLSRVPAVAILASVYLLGILTFVAFRAGRMRRF